jgi:hypothetical protein
VLVAEVESGLRTGSVATLFGAVRILGSLGRREGFADWLALYLRKSSSWVRAKRRSSLMMYGSACDPEDQYRGQHLERWDR